MFDNKCFVIDQDIWFALQNMEIARKDQDIGIFEMVCFPWFPS